MTASILLAIIASVQTPTPAQQSVTVTHPPVSASTTAPAADVAAGRSADDSVSTDDGKVKGRSVPGQAFHEDPSGKPPAKPCPPAPPTSASGGVAALRCPQ